MNQPIFKIGDTVRYFYDSTSFKIKEVFFKIKVVGFIISISEVFGLYGMKVTMGNSKSTFHNHVRANYLTPCRILLIEKTT